MSQSTQLFVTAFIAPQSLLELSVYNDAPAAADSPVKICVGLYMSDHTITRLITFNNPVKALNYAFILKGENCPISKNAFNFLSAEIKRVKAINARAKAEAKVKAQDDADAKAMTEAEAADTKDEEADKKLPLLKQYKEMKQKHPDAILLFRIGDFYEVLREDAIVASEILGITITRRTIGKEKYLEFAGFPHHALDTYLPKLVRAGKRVAICEELEKPKPKKRTKKAEKAA